MFSTSPKILFPAGSLVSNSLRDKGNIFTSQEILITSQRFTKLGIHHNGRTTPVHNILFNYVYCMPDSYSQRTHTLSYTAGYMILTSKEK